MINIAIVEDDNKSSELIINYLKKYSGEYNLPLEYKTFNNGIDFLKEIDKGFTAVFMDIDLPKLNGMETSLKLRKIDKNIIIVFVTNLPQFAIDGYKVEALDFILKPLNYIDFKVEMDKIKEKQEINKNEFLMINLKGISRKIELKKVTYIEILNHNVIIHFVDEKDFIFRGTLAFFEDKLNKNSFFRCNNCYIVNVMYIKAVINDELELVDSTRLTISRNRKKEFLTFLTFSLNQTQIKG